MTATNISEAFEYVLGSIRGEERLRFEKQLRTDNNLQLEVQFWEEQLMTLNASEREVIPHPNTWQQIQAGIQNQARSSSGWLANRQPWRLAAFCTLLLLVAVFVFYGRPTPGINADYIAVLTDDEGAAKLTAITESGGNRLWLQWSDTAIAEQTSLQLWAVSERDGQSRSLAVFEGRGFDGSDYSQLSLNETNLRLIRDASHLVLTEEELGGSPIDEPSDIVIARGACVRLASIESSDTGPS